MIEAALDRACGARVRAGGGWWLKLAPQARRGIPDRLLLLPGGRVVFVELKTPTGRLSPAQRHCITALNNLGVTAVVIRTVEQLDALLRGVD